ncbi:MAG: hypothetical protein ACI4LY_04240 [Candidatus Fimisoma sp.]
MEPEKNALAILITEEDKTGRDIAKMSNFFDGYIQSLSTQLYTTSTVEIFDTVPVADLGIINEVATYAEALMQGKYGYLPDFDSLPIEIRQNLKKGIYTIGESRQVEGNMRAVILDENGVRIKDITLKKVVNDPGTMDMARNLANQFQLRQINAKLGVIQDLQSYQIDRDRDRDIVVPFLNARDYILRAQMSHSIEEQKTYLLKASDELTKAINSLYTDMDTTSKWVSRLTMFPIFQPTPLIHGHISRLTQDLQLATKYVGVQMQVFDYIGERDNAMLELDKYRMVMRDFSDKSICRGKSALTLMQEHSPYDENNKDCWHKLSVEMRPFLQNEQNPLEELYLVSAEDIHEEEN